MKSPPYFSVLFIVCVCSRVLFDWFMFLFCVFVYFVVYARASSWVLPRCGWLVYLVFIFVRMCLCLYFVSCGLFRSFFTLFCCTYVVWKNIYMLRSVTSAPPHPYHSLCFSSFFLLCRARALCICFVFVHFVVFFLCFLCLFSLTGLCFYFLSFFYFVLYARAS